MHGMQYQIVLKIQFWSELTISHINLRCELPFSTTYLCKGSDAILLLHHKVNLVYVFLLELLAI